VVESLRRRADRFGLDVVLVNVWEGSGAAVEASGYRDRWDLQGTILLDETAAYARKLGVRGVPTNVFVDGTGTVLAVGATTTRDLLRDAARLEPRLRGIDRELLGTQSADSGFSF
jgi:hypothetical protein